MKLSLIKKLELFMVSLLLLSSLNVSLAASKIDCPETLPDPPKPTQIVCPFIRLINITVGLVGALIVVMCVYGGIKLSLSLGDPKGYAGAQSTWFWAVVGGGVIVLFYSGIKITAGVFGIKIPGPDEVTNDVVSALQSLLVTGGIN